MLKHLDYLFTALLGYLLKCLKGQGLPAKQLNVVFCAIVMSRILYALPGFLTNDLVAKCYAF